jgi:hypothetical protein
VKTKHLILCNIADGCLQPPLKKALMLVLAGYCHRDGTCSPNIRHLADVMGVDEPAMKQMLSELVADGELEVLGE